MFPLKQFISLPILSGLSFITVTASQATTHHNFIPVGFPSSTQPTHHQTLIAQKQSKVALVIGNAAYEEEPLSNPVNDATDMAKALQELGFEVILLQNRDLRTMKDEINKFRQQLKKGGVGLFYYAGHGIQVDGENYLIPLKAELNIEKDVEHEAFDLKRVLNYMEAAETWINIVIIDACRENLFYRQWPSRYRSLSNRNRGLAAVQSPPQGTIITLATAPGELAADGINTRNSPFTSALLQHIKTPNLDIQLMLRQVRTLVWNKTNGIQKPWTEANLVGGEFYLNPQPNPNSVATSSPQPNSTPEIIIPTPKPNPLPVSPPPLPKPNPTEVAISKVTGINYTKLQELLKEKKWKEADDTTFTLLLESAKARRQNLDWVDRNWLNEEDINKLACEDLKIIDRLWSKYSNNQLGLSVQSKLWENARKNSTTIYDNYSQFVKSVKWIRSSSVVSGSTYISSNDINYINPPQGHLPIQMTDSLGKGWSDWGSHKHLHLVYSRFANCLKNNS